MRTEELIHLAKDLRKSKQPLSIEQLKRIATKADFSVRNGGKHIRYASSDYPSISGSFMSSDKTAISKLCLADAIDRVVERNLEKQKSIEAEFNKAREDRLAAIREKLPEHITAELTQDGLVVLRDVQIPQIGVTLYSEKDEREINNRVRKIEDDKRDFYKNLCILHDKYDADATFENGRFTGTINHTVYKTLPALYVAPYQAGDTWGKAQAELDVYKSAIKKIDTEHWVRKEIALEGFDVSMSYNTPRGERHHHIIIKDSDGKSLTKSFTTTSNQRITRDGTRGRIPEDKLAELERIMTKARSLTSHQTENALQLKAA